MRQLPRVTQQAGQSALCSSPTWSWAFTIISLLRAPSLSEPEMPPEFPVFCRGTHLQVPAWIHSARQCLSW